MYSGFDTSFEGWLSKGLLKKIFGTCSLYLVSVVHTANWRGFTPKEMFLFFFYLPKNYLKGTCLWLFLSLLQRSCKSET